MNNYDIETILRVRITIKKKFGREIANRWTENILFRDRESREALSEKLEQRKKDIKHKTECVTILHRDKYGKLTAVLISQDDVKNDATL